MTTSDDQGDPTPEPEAYDPVAAAGEGRRRKHAASESGLRLPAWMIGLAALLVIGLVVWLVLGLSGGDDETGTEASESATPTTTTSASAASLPSLLCTGPSYVVVETGASEQDMLDDVAATESQFPGSQLSKVPGGCIQGSSAVDAVVLALGPFDTFEAACTEAKALQGVSYKAYSGSADQGLVETPCP